MKNRKIFWGSVLILSAVIIILQELGITTEFFESIGGISVWDIISGIGGLALLITSLVKLEFGWSVILLSTLFFTFEDNIAFLVGRGGEDLANNWLILASAVLIAIGLSLLFGNFKKKYSHENVFGDTVVYIDSSTLTPDLVSNKLGDCDVFFENQELYPGGKTLKVSNKMGDIAIHVPPAWKLEVDISNNMGDIHIDNPPYEDADGMPLLKITGENKMGDVIIKYN